MTRSILTTAALAACLAAGVPLAVPSTLRERAREPRTAARDTVAPLPGLLALGDRLLAVHCAAAGGTLGVAVLSDAPLPEGALRLWAGRKNGWGSHPAVAEPVPDAPLLYAATVALPEPLPAEARLWLGLERGRLRPATAALPLPG